MAIQNKTIQKGYISVRDFAAKTGFSEGYAHKLWNKLHYTGETETAIERNGKHLFAESILKLYCNADSTETEQDRKKTEAEHATTEALVQQLQAENERLLAQFNAEREERQREAAAHQTELERLHKALDQQQQLSLLQLQRLPEPAEQQPAEPEKAPMSANQDPTRPTADELDAMTGWQRLKWAFRGKV